MPEPLRRRIRARALRISTGTAALFPAPLLRAALSLGARLAAWSPYERVTLANLELSLGTETTPEERQRIARGVRRHTVRLIENWLRLARGAPHDSERGGWIEDVVELDDSVAILDAELARGRGAIVVTAHLGDWELLCARLRRRGHTGAVVGLHKSRDPSADWLTDMRAGYGVETLSQRSNPRELLRVLQSGGTLGLLCDLEVRRLAGTFLPFLGVDALTMTAPAALARAHRLPLVPVRCVLPPGGSRRYRLSCGEPLEFHRELPRKEATAELMGRVNGVFGGWIRETPEQWAWHQKRWRTRPGELEATPLSSR